MLIAFQRMAIDLLTSLIFILIFFAGFFLALSLAFARNLYTAQEVAFKLLQLIFGFSPAAWALLPEINWIGKILLLTFMVNTNYLVVTILVSVLSTTFSSVIANAHEEHQYLFALNTILAVKSDALFFYQAPLNLIEWCLAPLGLIMPRPRWIRLNRYFIKFTHFPMLATIYMFERFYLRPRAFVPQDLLLARTVSLDQMRGVSAGEGQRSISGNFFGRRNRRESDAQQKNSEEILQQVFNNTRLARKQQGYGAISEQLGGKRTTDWVARLPEHVLSPGGVTPSDGTPEHGRKSSYFDGGPPRRPDLAKRSATAILLSRQLPSTTQKVQPVAKGNRFTSASGTGAQSDPEDFAPNAGSPKDMRIRKPTNGKTQRRSTNDSFVDPKARAIDFDSGDDEMDDEDVHDESSDSDAGIGGRRTEEQTDVSPVAASPRVSYSSDQNKIDNRLKTRNGGQQRVRPSKLSSWTTQNSRTSVLKQDPALNISSSVPRSIQDSKGSQRRQHEPELANYSSSLATQLAAHGGGDEGDFLSRMIMNRVDGIESAVKGGHSRIERLESTLDELVRELKRARRSNEASTKSSSSDNVMGESKKES